MPFLLRNIIRVHENVLENGREERRKRRVNDDYKSHIIFLNKEQLYSFMFKVPSKNFV